jgi:V8-like Glu-specific endopeptidase
MAKSKPRAGRAARTKVARVAAPAPLRRAARWAGVRLRDEAADQAGLLGVDAKNDSDDASRRHVRGRQFSDSFMMGTNGGATYEELLRPRNSAADAAVTVAAAAAADGGAYGGAVAKRAGRPRIPRQGLHRHGLQNVLGGTDDRIRIDDTSLIPARSIGLLRIRPEDGEERFGTAWLIGPRTLATAAHNLLHPEAGPTVSLEVGLAFDGNAEAWRDDPSGDNPSDFAVIRIADATVGNKLGWFGYANYEDAKFGDLAVNIFGYPMDVAAPFHMYGSKGRIVSTGQRRIFYDCDAGGGMSGGPVVALFGEKRIAVGIHVAGGAASNVATRITGPAFELFERHKSW